MGAGIPLARVAVTSPGVRAAEGMAGRTEAEALKAAIGTTSFSLGDGRFSTGASGCKLDLSAGAGFAQAKLFQERPLFGLGKKSLLAKAADADAPKVPFFMLGSSRQEPSTLVQVVADGAGKLLGMLTGAGDRSSKKGLFAADHEGCLGAATGQNVIFHETESGVIQVSLPTNAQLNDRNDLYLIVLEAYVRQYLKGDLNSFVSTRFTGSSSLVDNRYFEITDSDGRRESLRLRTIVSRVVPSGTVSVGRQAEIVRELLASSFANVNATVVRPEGAVPAPVMVGPQIVIKDMLSAIATEADRLTADLTAKESQLGEKQAELDGLAARVNELTAELGSRPTSQDLQEKHAELALTRRKLAEANESLGQTSGSLISSKEEGKRLHAQIDELGRTNSRLQEENAALTNGQQRIAELEKQRSKFLEDVRSLEARIEEMSAMIERFSPAGEENKVLRGALTEVEEHYQRMLDGPLASLTGFFGTGGSFVGDAVGLMVRMVEEGLRRFNATEIIDRAELKIKAARRAETPAPDVTGSLSAQEPVRVQVTPDLQGSEAPLLAEPVSEQAEIAGVVIAEPVVDPEQGLAGEVQVVEDLMLVGAPVSPAPQAAAGQEETLDELLDTSLMSSAPAQDGDAVAETAMAGAVSMQVSGPEADGLPDMSAAVTPLPLRPLGEAIPAGPRVDVGDCKRWITVLRGKLNPIESEDGFGVFVSSMRGRIERLEDQVEGLKREAVDSWNLTVLALDGLLTQVEAIVVQLSRIQKLRREIGDSYLSDEVKDEISAFIDNLGNALAELVLADDVEIATFAETYESSISGLRDTAALIIGKLGIEPRRRAIEKVALKHVFVGPELYMGLGNRVRLVTEFARQLSDRFVIEHTGGLPGWVNVVDDLVVEYKKWLGEKRAAIEAAEKSSPVPGGSGNGNGKAVTWESITPSVALRNFNHRLMRSYKPGKSARPDLKKWTQNTPDVRQFAVMRALNELVVELGGVESSEAGALIGEINLLRDQHTIMRDKPYNFHRYGMILQSIVRRAIWILRQSEE